LRNHLSLAALVVTILVVLLTPTPSHAITWTHDCGGYYGWTSVWDSVHYFDDGTGCDNYSNYVLGAGGFCHTGRFNNSGEVFHVDMNCPSDQSCELSGFMTCNGVKSPFDIACTTQGVNGAVAVQAKGDSLGVRCATVDQQGIYITNVSCSCDGSAVVCSMM